MITLRIWHPSPSNKSPMGSSALSIEGVWGTAHMSTRPEPVATATPTKPQASASSSSSSSSASVAAPTQAIRSSSANTTLMEDIAAEGRDTDHVWIFRNMDEIRMLCLWGTLKQAVRAVHEYSYDPASSFRISDLILAAGRGIDVEENPLASLTGRARGFAVASAVATSAAQLHVRADYYAQVEHW